MFSNLSSLLPAALSERLDKLELLHGNDSRSKDQLAEQGIKERDMAVEGIKKEKKKKVSSNETFIVVRPPPAKSNHPLNLQLQLVPAHHSRDRSNTSAATTPTNSRFSVDFTQGNEVIPPTGQAPPSPAVSESDQGLKRTPSVRSNRSDTSAFYSSSAAVSAGSVTSFASTGSTSSGRRMIIPLYNLSAHNVMTNTVLDAGTDAKVARFGKRGIEIIGLAILEPTEVWNGTGKENALALGVPIHRSSSGTSSLAPPKQNGSRAATPDPSHSPGSSRLSLSSDHSSSHGRPVITPASTPTAPTPTGSKKLFGRIFRKKEGSGGGGHSRSPSTASVTPAVALSAPTPTPEARAPSTSRQASVPEVFLPAVLGLSPTLGSGPNPPTGRCISYVWIVRKWLKVENQNLISGVLGKIGREASAHGIGHIGDQDPSEWEVRFEWERSKSKGGKARRAARRSVDASAKRQSRQSSRRNSQLVSVEDEPSSQQASDGIAISIDSPRRSLDGVQERQGSRTPSPRRPQVSATAKAVSVSSTTPSDEEGAHPTTADDAGNESDPEDSETPWTCSMILTHPQHPAAHLSPPTASSAFLKGHSRTRTVSSSGAVLNPTTPNIVRASMSESGHGAPVPTPIKVKVATLAPAPHHPKVVCQLKVPFPLPDVEVHQGILRKRLILPDGTTRSTIPREHVGMAPLIMTAEEIKDVVCSTAFWVVVREGFGGLGKKNRKGDGWKIRG